jgi:transketolase
MQHIRFRRYRLNENVTGMTVINTCDYNQTKAATLADHHGPAYLRFGRPVVQLYASRRTIVIGKAIMLSEGTDVTIVATGHLVWEAFIASIRSKRISKALLANIHTIKP